MHHIVWFNKNFSSLYNIIQLIKAGDTGRHFRFLIALEEARRQFASVEDFQDVLLMEYLEGPEYSIDCLAQNSRLIRATVRKKSMRAGGPEILEKNEVLYDLAERLMAGGIYFSCLAGVNYPYWAIRMAIEDCEMEIPHQRFGLRVNQAYKPFVLKCGNAEAVGR